MSFDPIVHATTSCPAGIRGQSPVSFDPIAYINEPRWQSSRLGLDRIGELLDLLGRPQDALKFVHVAGTNGKGSTCAYLASILQEAGLRIGLFTSPYVEVFEERVRVDGENIPLDELTDVTLAVRKQAEQMDDHPTEFELMTAVALVHFSRRACDVVVLEVGLGGRFDSTNIIDAPEVAVIARIGLDHTAILGDTLAAIAGEKAGIIKQGIPVVSWPQEAEPMAVVRQVAASQEATLTSPDFSTLGVGVVDGARLLVGAEATPSQPLVRVFAYKGYDHLETQLLGSYQPANAALAIEVIDALRRRGWAIDNAAIRAGVAKAQWPGRFEVVAGAPAFVLDGGHNPQGAQALASSLADVFPGVQPVFIIGVLEDKNYTEMLEAVLPLARGFVLVTPDNQRALPADGLAQALGALEKTFPNNQACLRPYIAADMADAIKEARRMAGESGLVCAFGSLYAVGALKSALRQPE